METQKISVACYYDSPFSSGESELLLVRRSFELYFRGCRDINATLT